MRTRGRRDACSGVRAGGSVPDLLSRGSVVRKEDRPPAAPGPLDTAVTVTPDGATSSGVRSGSVVVLNVSYSGGCATHRFTLVASETFMESFPVQLAVLLAHGANRDACEAWLTEDYRFDLRAIRDRYREAYGWGPGEVVLLLDDAPSGPLVYAFDIAGTAWRRRGQAQGNSNAHTAR